MIATLFFIIKALVHSLIKSVLICSGLGFLQATVHHHFPAPCLWNLCTFVCGLPGPPWSLPSLLLRSRPFCCAGIFCLQSCISGDDMPLSPSSHSGSVPAIMPCVDASHCIGCSQRSQWHCLEPCHHETQSGCTVVAEGWQIPLPSLPGRGIMLSVPCWPGVTEWNTATESQPLLSENLQSVAESSTP